MSSHVTPLRTYMAVFGALMGLTALTTAVAFVDLGALNDTVAMAIATTKVVLVVLWFMHVKASGKLIWLFAGAGFFWLLILFGLTLADYGTRVNVPGWGG